MQELSYIIAFYILEPSFNGMNRRYYTSIIFRTCVKHDQTIDDMYTQ